MQTSVPQMEAAVSRLDVPKFVNATIYNSELAYRHYLEYVTVQDLLN